MDKLLEPLDPKMRMSVSLSLALLAFFACCVALNRMLSGPWMTALALALIAGICTNLVFKAWPKDPPQAVGAFMEKWSKTKGRSRKSAGGRFVWNVGRSMIAGLVAAQVLGLVSDVTGPVETAMLAGFALSAGFFGIRASAWSGIFVFFVGHRLALAGLNVDFADPASRNALATAWRNGGMMSWWWPLGLAAAAPLWIGLAAISLKVGGQIVEDLVARQQAVAAKKKIEARRERLRVRRDQDGPDPITAAIKAREEAQARVEAAARGSSGMISGSESEAAGKAAAAIATKATTELRGVAKLEHDKNEATLTRYIAHVRSIRESQANKLDVDTAARRSFDRVIQALDDKQMAFLKSRVLPGSEVLEAYYNELCGIEAMATSGGDGEIVSTFPSYGDVLDAEGGFTADPDYEPASFDRSAAVTLPVSNNEDDDTGVLEVDMLDAVAQQASISRRAAVAVDVDMMLANSESASAPKPTADLREGPDGTPEGIDSLPVARVAPPEISSVEYFGAAETLENDALNETPAGLSPETTGGEGKDQTSDGGDLSAMAENNEGDVPEVAAPANVEANAPQITQHAESGAEAPDGAVTMDSDGQGVDPVSDQDRRNAAGKILARKLDREFVLGTLDYFPTLAAAAGAIGLPEELFEAPFDIYHAQVVGARQEIELARLLEGEDAEAVRLALAAVKAASWDCDPELLVRAEAWVQRKADEAQERANAEARADEDRKRQADEARERAEAVEREERDRRAREEKAAEDAARERELAEAEALRLEELDANRRQYAVHLLVGAYGDDLLDLGDDLFPNVEALAEALGLDTAVVQTQFDDFTAKRVAKQKLDALKQAWNVQDLFAVQALINDPASFEAYQGYEDVLEGAQTWAKGEEAKQRVLGLNDKFKEVPKSTDDAVGKKFMRRMNKTTDEQVDLIETKLPMALTIANSLSKAITAMGDAVNPVMVVEHAKALSEAARAAALIVDHEKACREYVLAYFPKDHRQEGVDVWSMLVELASKGDTALADAPTQVEIEPAAMDAPADQVEAAGAGFTPRALDLGPKVLSVEEVQALDPATQIKALKHGPLKSRADYERIFHRICVPLLGPDEDSKELLHSDGPFGYSMYLGEQEGVELGRLVFFTHLERPPVWYHEETDKVYFVDAEDNYKTKSQNGKDFMAKLELYFEGADKRRDQVRGLVLVSPSITADGITSFAPLLNKIQKGPVIIQNERLSGELISALVEKIKGA